jgi:hypothetical protein
LNTIQQFRRSGLNALFALDETLCLADGEWYVFDPSDGWLRYSPIFCPDLQENPPSLESIKQINAILCKHVYEENLLVKARARASASRQMRDWRGRFSKGTDHVPTTTGESRSESASSWTDVETRYIERQVDEELRKLGLLDRFMGYSMRAKLLNLDLHGVNMEDAILKRYGVYSYLRA